MCRVYNGGYVPGWGMCRVYNGGYVPWWVYLRIRKGIPACYTRVSERFKSVIPGFPRGLSLFYTLGGRGLSLFYTWVGEV